MNQGNVPKAQHLSRYLRYDEASGKLYWRKRKPEDFEEKNRTREAICNMWNAKFSGKEALSSPTPDGYLAGQLYSQPVRAHHAVWALCTGHWPKAEIDHIDGNPSNNRIENLRVADRTIQNRNSARRKDNTSGVTGVSFDSRTGRWRARIPVSGKQVYLGYFDSKHDAAVARKAAEKVLGFHENHGRRGRG